jgi:2-iminobutanoate/2-iminopropanoate deaminase
MPPKAIQTDAAPAALGPYSQAIQTDNTLYLSGQLGIDPAVGKLVSEEAAAQAKQALENIRAILQAAGFALSDVVQVLVLLTNINDFGAINAIYKVFFRPPYPARAAYAVAALPAGAAVEIIATAVRNT